MDYEDLKQAFNSGDMEIIDEKFDKEALIQCYLHKLENDLRDMDLDDLIHEILSDTYCFRNFRSLHEEHLSYCECPGFYKL